jgi:hypothetical protein
MRVMRLITLIIMPNWSKFDLLSQTVVSGTCMVTSFGDYAVRT